MIFRPALLYYWALLLFSPALVGVHVYCLKGINKMRLVMFHIDESGSERGFILEETAEEEREGFLWACSVKKSTSYTGFFCENHII